MMHGGIVTILRYDPEADPESRNMTFEDIPYKNFTVLNVLNFIYDERDPSLAFRGRLCTRGFCGGCGLMVNGRPCMPCTTLAEREMIIEPHPSFKVVKDLVCDWEQVDDDLSRLDRIKKPYPTIMVDAEKCVHCRDCILTCPVGVYDVVDKKVAVVNHERCLGRLCQLCSDACWKTALKVTD